MMNAILIKSNQSLINIGRQLGMDVGELQEWQQQSVKSFNEKCWNDELNIYTSFDLRGQKQIAEKEIGGLIPLFAGIPDASKAGLLHNYLTDLHQRDFYLCPSFDVDSPQFDSKRYWRGPIWPHMNWMIYHGLKKYGYEQTANILKADTLELVKKFGFYEYYEPQKSLAKNLLRGYGGDTFSWTASSIIDLIHNK
ncbi:MAG: trehalase family glycosidase [Chitinophagales bacterium]